MKQIEYTRKKLNNLLNMKVLCKVLCISNYSEPFWKKGLFKTESRTLQNPTEPFFRTKKQQKNNS